MKNSIIKLKKVKMVRLKKCSQNELGDWVDYWSVDFDFENKKKLLYKMVKTNGQMIIC